MPGVSASVEPLRIPPALHVTSPPFVWPVTRCVRAPTCTFASPPAHLPFAGVSALKKLQEAKEFLAKSEDTTPPPASAKSPSKQADRPPKVDLFK